MISMYHAEKFSHQQEILPYSGNFSWLNSLTAWIWGNHENINRESPKTANTHYIVYENLSGEGVRGVGGLRV